MKLPKLHINKILGTVMKSALFLPLLLGMFSFLAYPYVRPMVSGQFEVLATVAPGTSWWQQTLASHKTSFTTTTTSTPISLNSVATATTVTPTKDTSTALQSITYNNATDILTVNSSTSIATYNLVKNDQATETGLETTPRSGIALDGNLVLTVEFLGPDGTVVDTLSSQQAIHISFSTLMFGGKAVSSIRVKLTGSVTLTGAYSQTTYYGGTATTYGTVNIGVRINGLTSSSGQYLLSTANPTALVSQIASYNIEGRGTLTVEVLGTSDIGLRGQQITLSDGTNVNAYGWVRIYNIVGPKLSATIWENDPVGADQLKVPITTNIGRTAYFGLTSMPYPNCAWVQANSGNPVITINAKVPGTYKLDWISIPSDAPHSTTNCPVTTTFGTIDPTWGFEGRDFPLPTLSYNPFPITLQFVFVSPLADDELYIMTKPYSGGEFTTVATIRPGQKGVIAVNLQPNGLYDRYVGWKTKRATSSGLMDSTQYTYTTPRSYSEVWSSGKEIALTITAAYAASTVQSITMTTAPVVIQDSAKFIVKVYGPSATPASGIPVRAYSYDMNLRDRPWNGSFTTNSMGEVEIDPGFRVINRNSTQVKFFVYDPNGTTVIGQGIAPLWSLSPVYIVNIALQTPPTNPPAPPATKCTIFGRVTDENGLGLGSVYVTIIEDSFIQQTDAQGYYKLLDRPVPSSSYRIQASLTGYTSQVQSVAISAGQVKELNFQLVKNAAVTITPASPPGNNPNNSPVASNSVQAQPATTTNTVSGQVAADLTTESMIAAVVVAVMSFAVQVFLKRR
jgi:hypothetical protein